MIGLRQKGLLDEIVRRMLVSNSIRLLVGLIAAGAVLGPRDAQGQSWQVEDLGVPVRAVTYGNSQAVLAPGPGGQGTMFYTSYFCNTGAELIGYDHLSERMIRHKLPAQGGYAVATGPDRAVYIGGVNPGNLFRYDLRSEKLATIDVKRFGVDYIWAAEAGQDGVVYCAAGYPLTKLVAYDTAAGQARDLGEITPGQHYLRSLCVDSLGKVWCGVGMRAHIVVYDPTDDSKREALPPDLASNACVGHLKAVGDYVLAGVIFDGVLLVYDAKTCRLLHSIPRARQGMSWRVVSGGKGHTAYLQDELTQDLYRCDLRSGELALLARSPGQVQIVENDRLLHLIDDQDYVVYDLQNRGVVASKRFTQGGDGMDIFALTAGPDGNIYGSTYINMHMFRCDASTGALTDLGKCSRWPGQVDSLSLGGDGRIYIGAYIRAVLSSYDPELPWKPGVETDANPREIGPIGKGQYRTQTNCLGPDGKLYAGSIPSYNSAALGAFTICDLKTGAMNVRTDFVKGGAVNVLVADDKFVYGAGGGEFFVYDPTKGDKSFRADRACTALAVLGGEWVVASGGGKLFVYDHEQNQIVAESHNPAGDFNHMAAGPDGRAYGVNPACVAQVERDGSSVKIIAKPGGKYLAVDRQARAYFARGPQLFRCASARPAE